MATETIHIVEQLKTDPEKGLKTLFDQYVDKLYGYAVTNWGMNEEDSWELISDTFYRLIDAVNEYEFESQKHFENFLFKVFKNNLRQWYRKQQSEKQHITIVSLEETLVEGGDSDEQLLEAEEALKELDYNNSSPDISENSKLVLLEEALDGLSAFDKDLLLLRAQNFSYRQIADYLNLENNQLKVKYHRAKKKLLNQIVELQEDNNG